ncbi:uncharacterized protein LOC123211559 [Mangifera indica]|uniref:uncharacterized protein LOC123211559 n=1 Tax=Mangifera indica TaxID=29780 RepID=UPI001CFA10BB|nr:uncharacterized protein LOC123211559 [Mangifera indica]
MLFCHADGKSLSILLEPLGKFQNWFGLKMNHAKSNIFFGGISKEDIDKLRDIAKIDEGKLPIRYLGVPLVSIELSIDDCQPLIEKILGSELNYNKTKVAWDVVCLPKDKGGLVIMRSSDWNKAAILRHLWNLANKDKYSIWVEWTYKVLLKGKNVWEIDIPNDCSWCWRDILKLRDVARKHIRVDIGNGENCSLWFESWHHLGPIARRWPASNSQALLELKNSVLNPPRGGEDKVILGNGVHGTFSIKKAWDTTRRRNSKVDWYNIVWYHHHIPKHAILVWVAILGIIQDATCRLCNSATESLDHLFFSCSFTNEIWSRLMRRCSLNPAQGD